MNQSTASPLVVAPHPPTPYKVSRIVYRGGKRVPGSKPKITDAAGVLVAEVAVTVIDDWHGRGLGTALLDLLAALSHQTDFAIGCYCENEDRCHRSVLRALLAERGAALSSSPR